MAANAKVVLELVAENKKLLTGISQAVRETEKLEKGAKTATKSFGDMGTVLKGMAGFFSVAAATFAAKEIIQAANAHEKAVNKVSDALARVGADVGPSALKAIEEFATSVQKSTGVSSEMFLELQAKATSFGATSKEVSQKFAQAAIETAAATGQSAEEIVKKLSQTTQGEVGEIGKLLPGIKNLTKEQLAAGVAADKLLERFSGSSRSQMGEFAFELRKIELAFKDIKVATGSLITGNSSMAVLASEMSKAMEEISSAMKTNGSSFNIVIDGMIKGVADFISLMAQMAEATSWLHLPLSVMRGISRATGNGDPVSDFLQSIQDKAASIKQQIDQRNSANSSPQQQAASRIGSVFSTAPASGRGNDAQVASIYGQAGFIGPGNADQKTRDEAYAKWLQANVGPQMPPEVKAQRENDAKDLAKKIAEQRAQAVSGVNAGLGGLSSVLSGNAAGGVAGIAGFGADMLLPGIGGAVSGIVAELAKGPQHISDMFDQFFDNLPNVLQNIADAIPMVIDKLVDKAPDIANALARKMPDVARELAIALGDPRIAWQIAQGIALGLRDVIVEEVGRWGEALGPFFEDFIRRFFETIGNAFGDIGTMIWDAITGAFESTLNWVSDGISWIGNRFSDLFNWINELVGWVTGGAQKVGGFLGKVGGALGLASGGYVRGMGTGDSVPAMLAPGELVVDRETGPQLRSFLQGQGNQEAILMEMVSLLRQPMTVQTTAEVDKRAFASIMLTMSRQNQRLTA